MSTYELDDDLVRRWLDPPRLSTLDDTNSLAKMLAVQLPIPVPTKLGAVVRTDRGLAIRVSRGDREAWALWEATDRIIVDTRQIGRITEPPLSEGVDT